MLSPLALRQQLPEDMGRSPAISPDSSVQALGLSSQTQKGELQLHKPQPRTPVYEPIRRSAISNMRYDRRFAIIDVDNLSQPEDNTPMSAPAAVGSGSQPPAFLLPPPSFVEHKQPTTC